MAITVKQVTGAILTGAILTGAILTGEFSKAQVGEIIAAINMARSTDGSH